MPAHHVLAHLLGMLPHKRHARGAVGKRIFDAATQDAVHGTLHVDWKRTIHDDPAERNGRACFAFPEFAKVDDLLQALRGVREAVFVNDEPRVEPPVEHRSFDVRKQQLRLVQRRRKRQAEKKVRRRVSAWNRDRELPGRDLVPRDRPLRDQQRSAVASKRAAGIQQDVVVCAVRVRVITQLRDVRLAGKRRGIQRFDVCHADRELETLEIDPPVDDRVEHEAIVRAR